jgi:hypothetical protein
MARSEGTSRKLTGAALARFEASRDIWGEVLQGIRDIKAGGGRRSQVKAAPPVAPTPPSEGA